MLADDHDAIREGLTKVLTAEPDLEVVGEARDGEAALELVRLHCPDVAVLDVTMPGMNGIAAARAITDEFPKVRVVGLSVHEAADMRSAMISAGAAEYLNKADSSSNLLAAIRSS